MENVKRDYTCDLIRIIATYIVIATHVKLGIYENDYIKDSRLFFACLFSDGVSIFFILSGFFMFNGRTFYNIVKKCIFSIVFPAFGVAVFTQLIFPWINSNALWEHLSFRLPWSEIISAILQQNAGSIPGCFHFWYIFAYVKWILFYPLLKWICQNEKEPNQCRLLLIALQFISIAVNNIKLLFTFPLSTFSFFDASILLGLIGFELNCRKDFIKRNLLIRLISFIFLIINIISRLHFQKLLYFIDKENGSYINWDSVWGIVGATTIFIFIYSFDLDNIKTKNIIKFVSNRTLSIYLFHVIIYFKCNSLGISKNFFTLCLKLPFQLGELFYSLGYPLFIFAIALLFVTLLFTIKKSIVHSIHLLKHKSN